MKLTDLEPRFIRYESRIETWKVVEGDPATWRERGCPSKEVTGPREWRIFVPTLAEAQGIIFLCPKCYTANGGATKTHLCEATFAGRGVSDEMGTHNKESKPVRWNVSGTSFDDLSTTPSILLEGGCEWHGWITAGEIK